MDSLTNRRWQFSLRTLMLAMLACALFFGVGEAFGFEASVWAAFALLVVVPAAMLPEAAKYAWPVAVSAVYGPFVVMATYTYFFVSCSHCKETTWAMLPYGPGVVPVELTRRWLDLGRPFGMLSWVTMFLVGAVLAAVLTWILRTCAWWWQAIGISGVLALCAFGAFVVLALIRA